MLAPPGANKNGVLLSFVPNVNAYPRMLLTASEEDDFVDF